MSMLNREAVGLIAARREGAVVVTTMSSIFSVMDLSPSPLNVRVAPLMGGASSIGLGIALARPDRKVIVLDGDGSLAMQLGTLLTVAEAAPANYYHFVFHNGLLYEGGGRVHIAGAQKPDFCGLARSAGYRSVHDFSTKESLEKGLPGLLAERGPVFARLEIALPATPRWSENNPQGELPDWWFAQMPDDARACKEALARAR
ncbi:MAG: thiamine pyrophosphate-binding protein [Alphaproteobacteria bacterium]|nr:thiamine pyrophosphate-binding protein [Alphaproteobacteria bacterium]